MTAKVAGMCVFGSNLFHQLDPADTSNPTKQIRRPRKIDYDKRLPTGITSFDLLHASDSQSLVFCTTSSKGSNSSNNHLQVWGFDDNTNSIVNEVLPLDALGRHPCLSHPIDLVKLWLGRNTVVGYLAKDGTINPFNLKYKDSIGFQRRQPASRHDGLKRYQAVSISDNGQVLAAISLEWIKENMPADLVDPKTNIKPVHRLELWSSFEELLESSMVGSSKTDFYPKSFELKDSPCGQTEVQLASGASHFLMLTHTPPSTPHNLDEKSTYTSTLYALGDNRFGQLGIGCRSVSVNEPKAVEDLPAIMKIDCGLFHSVIVGQDGELYTFGHNRKGQCGVGTQMVDLTFPLLIDLGGNGESGEVIDVIDVSCGSEHTILLTSLGVWVSGSNAVGQLGLESDLDRQLEFQLNDTIAPSCTNACSNWKIQAGRWNTFIWSTL